MKYEIENFKYHYYKYDNLITIIYYPKMKQILNWICKLLNLKNSENTVRKKYIGNNTVFHEYPEFSRCDTCTERWLSNINSKLEYEHNNVHE